MEYVTTISANEPIVITIGNFDGVHKGHQSLMQELNTTARELQCKPVLVTFSPHTLMVVRPDIDLYNLTTLKEKLALAKLYGSIADSIVINFTPEVAALSPEQFLDSLCTHFTIKGLVVGANFSFGHNRQGNVAFLERYGQQHDILVRTIPLEEAEHTRISSTRIRSLVSEGNVAEAQKLLGHPVTLSGIVMHGDQRGRLLGFPTANLKPDPHKLVPAHGVYAVRVSMGNTPASNPAHISPVYNGAANIGVRPTFNGTERIVEAHLLDVHPDLYDQYITVEFIDRIRNEQRFSGIDALKAQIAADVQQARQILQSQSQSGITES